MADPQQFADLAVLAGLDPDHPPRRRRIWTIDAAFGRPSVRARRTAGWHIATHALVFRREHYEEAMKPLAVVTRRLRRVHRAADLRPSPRGVLRCPFALRVVGGQSGVTGRG
jgi:hypothetical protein